jgi:hypothetical protein
MAVKPKIIKLELRPNATNLVFQISIMSDSVPVFRVG